MKVVNLRDYPGKGMTRELPEGVVRVDRRSKYGNPFKVGEGANRYHGGYDRDTVISLHRKWLIERLAREPGYLEPLRSAEAIACWCRSDDTGLGLPCHSDNIVDWFEGRLK